MLKKSLLILGLALAAPVAAQNASPALSAEGKQTYQTVMKSRNAEMAPLLARKRELEKQFDALLASGSFDEAKFTSVMADMQKVEGQIYEARGTALVAVLKALPEADRAIFMKSISKTPPKAATYKPGQGR